jgi:hypothetical protein
MVAEVLAFIRELLRISCRWVNMNTAIVCVLPPLHCALVLFTVDVRQSIVAELRVREAH